MTRIQWLEADLSDHVTVCAKVSVKIIIIIIKLLLVSVKALKMQ